MDLYLFSFEEKSAFCVNPKLYMILFVFAGAKRRSEISKVQCLIPANFGVATLSLQKVLESADDSCVFLIYFAVQGLVFKLKETLEVKRYPEMNSQPPKWADLLWRPRGR